MPDSNLRGAEEVGYHCMWERVIVILFISLHQFAAYPFSYVCDPDKKELDIIIIHPDEHQLFKFHKR